MKSLSDLKRRLRNAIGQPQQTVSLSFFDLKGVERLGSQQAPVVVVASTQFAVKRPDGKYGYVNFWKASNWTFAENVAIQTHPKTAEKAQITFHQNPA